MTNQPGNSAAAAAMFSTPHVNKYKKLMAIKKSTTNAADKPQQLNINASVLGRCAQCTGVLGSVYWGTELSVLGY